MKWFFPAVTLSLLAGTIFRLEFITGTYIYFHDLVIGAFVVWAFISGNVRYQWYKRYFGVSGLFLIAMMLSLIMALGRLPLGAVLQGSLYGFRWVLFSLLFVVGRKSEDIRPAVIQSIVLFGVLFAFCGYLQYLVYPSLRNLSYLGWDPHEYRLFSTVLDPNFAGIILLVTVLVTLYTQLEGVRSKTWYRYALPFQGIAMVLTFSRGTYVAAIAAIITMVIRMNTRRRLKVMVFIVSVFLLTFLLVYVLGPRSVGTDIWRTETVWARLENIKYGMGLGMNAPVFGQGFNVLKSIQSEYVRQHALTDNPHSASGLDNSLVFLFATTGLFGLSAYGYLAGGLLSRVQAESGSDRRLGYGYLISSVLLAVSVHAMFVNSLFYPWVMVLVWLLAAGTDEKPTITSRSGR